MVAGVLVWLPILATIWVVSFMLHIMDRTLLLLPPSFRPQALVGFALPGAGLVLALVIVLLTGLLVTNLIGRRLIVWGEDLLQPHPGGALGLRRREELCGERAVAVQLLPQGGDDRVPAHGGLEHRLPDGRGRAGGQSERLGEPCAAVYLSAALNATAGYLVVVPRRQVVELHMSVDEAMKMIITCGVVVPHPAHAGAHLPARKARGLKVLRGLSCGAGSASVTSRASMRSHYCGQVNEDLLGQEVSVAGWVHRRRDHGGVIFVDVRDREGLLQVVFDPELAPRLRRRPSGCATSSWCRSPGSVRARPAGTVNPHLATGQVELAGARARGAEPLRAAAVPAR